MKKKTWFITGISSGLGKSLAEEVLKKGDFLIGTFRNQEQADAFNQLKEPNAKAVVLDLNTPENIEEIIDQCIIEYGQIDVLVNNAGVGFIGAIEEASLLEIRSVFETNFFGTLRLTQAVLPYMRKEKSGKIVQISSHGGIKAFAGFGIYNASKFALEGFSEALAQEVQPLGIDVIIVEPGPFRTNFAGKALLEAKKQINAYDLTADNFRTKLKAVHGKQEGDPVKAALAIIEQVYDKEPSLRMPLGKTAVKTIGMKIESLSKDLKTHQETAFQAIYEE